MKSNWILTKVIARISLLIPLMAIMLLGNKLQAQELPQTGKIKSVTEVVIESKGGKETEVRKSFRAYNEKGNLTEEIEYDDDGKIKNHTTSEYNEKQQKIKETAFLPDGKIESIALYTYDPEGNRISKTTMNKDGSVKSKKVFHYEYR